MLLDVGLELEMGSQEIQSVHSFHALDIDMADLMLNFLASMTSFGNFSQPADIIALHSPLSE